MMSQPVSLDSRPNVGGLFAYPFRIFFFSLAVWAVLIVPLWLAVLLTSFPLPLALPPLYWHQHEMLYGLLNAAIAGFLLTAVCTWTQTVGLQGGRLLALWLVWFSGRLAMLLGGDLPTGLAMLPDALFLPLVMLDAGIRIARARQARQILILVVLLLIWLTQMAFLLAPDSLFSSSGLILAMVLMLVVGGRITPAFTGNWLRAQGRLTDLPRSWPALDRAAIFSTLLVVPALLFAAWQPTAVGASPALAGLAIAAAALVLARLWGWRGWRVKDEPLLWILHLSLSWVPIALLLLAGTALGAWPATVWKHAVGTGAMAGLILGVISRVALGHTGRPLELPRGMVLAFVLIHTAALVRVLTALEHLPWRAGLELSAICWLLAFALFLWRYTAILASPRPEGRPG